MANGVTTGGSYENPRLGIVDYSALSRVMQQGYQRSASGAQRYRQQEENQRKLEQEDIEEKEDLIEEKIEGTDVPVEGIGEDSGWPELNTNNTEITNDLVKDIAKEAMKYPKGSQEWKTEMAKIDLIKDAKEKHNKINGYMNNRDSAIDVNASAKGFPGGVSFTDYANQNNSDPNSIRYIIQKNKNDQPVVGFNIGDKFVNLTDLYEKEMMELFEKKFDLASFNVSNKKNNPKPKVEYDQVNIKEYGTYENGKFVLTDEEGYSRAVKTKTISSATISATEEWAIKATQDQLSDKTNIASAYQQMKNGDWMPQNPIAQKNFKFLVNSQEKIEEYNSEYYKKWSEVEQARRANQDPPKKPWNTQQLEENYDKHVGEFLAEYLMNENKINSNVYVRDANGRAILQQDIVSESIAERTQTAAQKAAKDNRKTLDLINTIAMKTTTRRIGTTGLTADITSLNQSEVAELATNLGKVGKVYTSQDWERSDARDAIINRQLDAAWGDELESYPQKKKESDIEYNKRLVKLESDFRNVEKPKVIKAINQDLKAEGHKDGLLVFKNKKWGPVVQNTKDPVGMLSFMAKALGLTGTKFTNFLIQGLETYGDSDETVKNIRRN